MFLFTLRSYSDTLPSKVSQLGTMAIIIAVLVGIETLLRRFFYSIQVRAGFGCGGLGCMCVAFSFWYVHPSTHAFLPFLLLLFLAHIITTQHNTTQTVAYVGRTLIRS